MAIRSSPWLPGAVPNVPVAGRPGASSPGRRGPGR